MANVIVFGNQKGGVGKSTCALLCANALSQPPFGYSVAVIDIDRQKSIIDARVLDAQNISVAFPYEVFDFDLPQLEENIRVFDEKYDFVFVDVAGKLDDDTPLEEQETAKILMYTDWLFIPFRAGAFNLDASLRYLRFILQLASLRNQSPRPLQVRGFMNMYRSRHKLNRYLKEDIQQVQQASGIRMMTRTLNQYTIYEAVDTYTSYYDEGTQDTAKINFLLWLNELLKTMANG